MMWLGSQSNCRSGDLQLRVLIWGINSLRVKLHQYDSDVTHRMIMRPDRGREGGAPDERGDNSVKWKSIIILPQLCPFTCPLHSFITYWTRGNSSFAAGFFDAPYFIF
jgi:hypothetical protein